MMNHPAASAPGAAPEKPVCPFCRSVQVTTSSKSVTDRTYWRCHGCGEIWNQARLLAFHRRR
jgi:transposase-like protein